MIAKASLDVRIINQKYIHTVKHFAACFFRELTISDNFAAIQFREFEIWNTVNTVKI